MEKILNLILDKLSGLEKGQEELRKGQEELRKGQEVHSKKLDALEQGQRDLNNKMDAVYEQTALLTEFKTEITHTVNRLEQKIDILQTQQEQIISDIDILAGEIGKQKLEVERLKKVGRG
ncbi:MAG: hypothetical protein AB1796_13955 [Bacillota bacterium]